MWHASRSIGNNGDADKKRKTAKFDIFGTERKKRQLDKDRNEGRLSSATTYINGIEIKAALNLRYSLYNDHSLCVINEWSDVLNHNIILKVFSNKKDFTKGIFKNLIMVQLIAPWILHWCLWATYVLLKYCKKYLKFVKLS